MFTKRFGLIVVMACVGGLALAGQLQPRHELPKPALVIQPSAPHQLLVKFRDVLRVRCSGLGVESLTGGDVSDVWALADRHGVTFSPLINLPQEKLDALEQRAARISGVAQPDLAGMMVVHAPAWRLQHVADELNALPVTEFVHFQPTAPPPPCYDHQPPTPDFFSYQTYHGPDPGLNMTAAWALGSTRGAGIWVADCEFGVVTTHEDLCNIEREPGQTIHPGVPASWSDHGTAVFGEMTSLDGAYGCTGLVPDVERQLFFPERTVEQGYRRVTCITNAIAELRYGDVCVLEMHTEEPYLWQGKYGLPAEIDPAVWTVVKVGTDAGVSVVAAAGNGSWNLDHPDFAEYMARGDSGAIIVGAGSANTSHSKLGFSTYGSRVNVQGWGQGVFTLGYSESWVPGGGVNQRYTSGFSGTSSATPMAASCAIALQSLAVERLGHRLGPLEIRQILMNTGIPQGSGGHIGPLPDMVKAANYIRLLGDLNCDGRVDFDDIDAFVLALSGQGGYYGRYPDCRWLNADCDQDGDVDFDDVDPFVALLGG